MEQCWSTSNWFLHVLGVVIWSLKFGMGEPSRLAHGQLLGLRDWSVQSFRKPLSEVLCFTYAHHAVTRLATSGVVLVQGLRRNLSDLSRVLSEGWKVLGVLLNSSKAASRD